MLILYSNFEPLTSNSNNDHTPRRPHSSICFTDHSLCTELGSKLFLSRSHTGPADFHGRKLDFLFDHSAICQKPYFHSREKRQEHHSPSRWQSGSDRRD